VTVFRDTKKTAEELRVQALPFHEIIDKEGRVAATFVTTIDADLKRFSGFSERAVYASESFAFDPFLSLAVCHRTAP